MEATKKISALEEEFALQIRALKLPSPEREYKFLSNRKFRLDFAWIDKKICVEVDGGTGNNGRHVRFVGYHNDCHKKNLAVCNGWRLLQGDSKMVKSGQLVRYLEDLLKGE